MPLFILRRVHNPERKHWEKAGNVSENLIYVFHPTREKITEEEWRSISEQAEKRYKEKYPQFWRIYEQIGKELQKKGIKTSDPQHWPSLERRLKELGLLNFGIWKSLEEVLTEDGFSILKPEELTYQVPLTDWEAKMIANVERMDG